MSIVAYPQEPRLGRLRLTLLRAAYLLLAAGLLAVHLPTLLQRPAGSFELFEGVTVCMFMAMALLALLGLVRPLRMLPLLLFEIVWKTVWIARIAVPQIVAGQVADGTIETLFAVAFVLPIIAVTPWDVVWWRFLRRSRA